MSSFSIILGRDDPPKSNSTKTGIIATPAISLPVLVVKCVDQVLWRGGGIISVSSSAIIKRILLTTYTLHYIYHHLPFPDRIRTGLVLDMHTGT